MANSSFLKADSQTMYLLIGICLVTGLYIYNTYQGKLLRDMHIDKVEINANHYNLIQISKNPYKSKNIYDMHTNLPYM